MNKRTFKQIAIEIKKVWPKPYFGAVPYIDAMMCLDTTDPKAPYLFEHADEIVLRFLCNAHTFKGEDTRRIKAELKSMVK